MLRPTGNNRLINFGLSLLFASNPKFKGRSETLPPVGVTSATPNTSARHAWLADAGPEYINSDE
jgi:hypothetical protein